MQFHHYESRIYELSSGGHIQEALDLVARLPPEERGESFFFDYAEASLLAAAGRPSEALEVLRSVGASGGWISPETLRRDSDFNELAGKEEFEELCDRFRAGEWEARESGKPGPLISLPDGVPSGERVIVALHGDNSCAAHALEKWGSATQFGWSVVCPQSPEVGDFAGAYRWTEWATASASVLDALDTAWRELSQEIREPLIGGFSRGAEIATLLSCRGEVACRQLIAICPAPFRQPELLVSGDASILEEAYVFRGERDPQAECATKIATALRNAGVFTELDAREGLGHEYPPEFGELLARKVALLSIR